MTTTLSPLPVCEFASMVLENLGDTPDKVAHELVAREVVGLPKMVRQLNPIVRLIWGFIPEAQQVDIGLRDRLRIMLPGDRKEEVPLPPPVCSFLERFDNGHYPQVEIPLVLVPR